MQKLFLKDRVCPIFLLKSQSVIGQHNALGTRLKFNSDASNQQDKIKFEALLTLLASVTFSQCLIFTNFITKAESFCDKLNQHGWPAIFIASSQDQPTRLRALNR